MHRIPDKFLCGTPAAACGASLVKLNHGLDGRGIKAHGTREQAYDCQRRYLLSQGYKQVGSNAFAAPDEGPILVLSKKSRYGGKLRMGKEGTRNQPDGRPSSGIIWLL